jgi:DNA polymerase
MQLDMFPDVNHPEESARARLRSLGQLWSICRKCPLHVERRRVVMGCGKPLSPVLALVGEAPGEAEDREGLPFVGKSGELLTQMLVAAGLDRAELFVVNTVACRPPKNRPPEEAELKACSELFKAQMEIVRPYHILALGLTAAAKLLKTKKALRDLRGNWHDWEDIPVRVTYHPAALLRDPAKKPAAWADLVAVLRKIERPVPDLGPSPSPAP